MTKGTLEQLAQLRSNHQCPRWPPPFQRPVL